MGSLLHITEIKNLYPDEWVLIGNPISDKGEINIISGIPIYHSKDQKEVCYNGRAMTKDYDKITLIYTGTFKRIRKLLNF